MSDDPKLSWQLPFGTTWRSQTAEAWTTRRVTRGWHKKLRMHSEHLEDRVQAPGCKCEALSSNPSTTKKKKKEKMGLVSLKLLCSLFPPCCSKTSLFLDYCCGHQTSVRLCHFLPQTLRGHALEEVRAPGEPPEAELRSKPQQPGLWLSEW
jgi:hypothetical protein